MPLLHGKVFPHGKPAQVHSGSPALSFFPFLQMADVPGPCHPWDTFMILERWDREKEEAIELQTDPAFLGLFLLVSSVPWPLTCLYPAASPLTLV